MRFINKLKAELRNFHLMGISIFSNSKDKIENNVPYVSQFAHPEYAEKILKEGVDKTTDPNWRNTGAKSVDEYIEWVLTICGMACTVMALKFFSDRKYEIVTLAKDALNHDVYRRDQEEISHMHYKEYTDWITNYGIKAKVYSRLNIRGIQKLLSDKSLVIASVNPNIRGYETVSLKQEGGHLVLITGYDKKENTITLHNPSGFVSNNSQSNQTLSVQDFLRYYAGRGIALSSSE